MSEQTMRKLAKPMLFMAAFIWGSSFFIMKDALDQMPVQYLLAIRFTIGAALLGLVCGKKWRRWTGMPESNRWWWPTEGMPMGLRKTLSKVFGLPTRPEPGWRNWMSTRVRMAVCM